MQEKEKYTTYQIFFIVSLLTFFLSISSKTLISSFNRIFDNEIEGGITSYFYLLPLILFFISLIRAKITQNKKSSLNVILLYLFFYFFISYNFQITYTLKDFLSSFIIFSWILIFKLGIDLAKWDERKIRMFITLFVFFVIIPLSIQTYILYIKNGVLTITGNNIKVNDAVFSIAVYFPVVFAIEKQKFLKIILIISFLMISLLSFKRSIIIAVVFSLFIYIILYIDKKILFKYLRKWYSVLLLIFVAFIFRFLERLLGQDIFNRFNSIGTDRGSGRLDVYDNIFKKLYFSSGTNLLFGHGYQSTKKYFDILAHNDFIQILFDFGVIGALIYSLFLFYFIFNIFKNYKVRTTNRNEYASYVATLIFFLILTMLNCFIYSPPLLIPLVFILGLMYYRIYMASN